MITKKTLGTIALTLVAATVVFGSIILYTGGKINGGEQYLSGRENQKMGYSEKLTGRFLLEDSECAGFTFKDKKTALWTNELFCNDPDSLKISWIDAKNFITVHTQGYREGCPPRVDLYEVMLYNGKELVLKNTYTGWNDAEPSLLKFTLAK